MHIETELDDIHAERLLELQRRFNKPLSNLIADILSQAIDDAAAQPKTKAGNVLRILENHGLLGCMEGDGDLSVDYKKHLWRNS